MPHSCGRRTEQSFSKRIIEQIVSNRTLPKVQVERQVSPIFEIFIESLVNSVSKKVNLSSGVFRLVGPEFPLPIINKEEKTLRSTNIDFLLFNESSNSLLFVELKTDSSSFKIKQYEDYQRLTEKASQEGAGFLYSFLDELKNKKYKSYKVDIIDKSISRDAWREIRCIELLYIAPKRILSREWGPKNKHAISEINFLHFSDFPEKLEHEFEKDWGIIKDTLSQLDEN